MTKAENLKFLEKNGFNIPKFITISVRDWKNNKHKILREIKKKFENTPELAIRSSALIEDRAESSLAGKFKSILNVKKNKISISIDEVIKSYNNNLNNQVIIQSMAKNISMSGVIMSRNIEDGSPYYVLNYDDTSGRTDTVTGGKGQSKLVYIYRDINLKSFDSVRIRSLLDNIKATENIMQDSNLDIEFAVSKNNLPIIFQVRNITLKKKWENLEKQIKRYFLLKSNKFISRTLDKKNKVYYNTIFAQMSDWNPVEMIGVHPSTLSYSLYSELITNKIWSRARSFMGYEKVRHRLMENVFGQPVINTKLSFMSFLPRSLNGSIKKKLCNAWLQKLREKPEYHDKVEFEIASTCFDFNFKKEFKKRYKNLLNKRELNIYESKLKKITKLALDLNLKKNTLNKAIDDIKKLNYLLDNKKIDEIKDIIKICKKLGTLPFSIIARHAFIAEKILISLKIKKYISDEKVKIFRSSIKSITSELILDTYNLSKNRMSYNSFIKKYGHLRASTYDINAKSYKEQNLKNLSVLKKNLNIKIFKINNKENDKIFSLLKKNGFDLSTENLFSYISLAIKQREYAKFIFTKCINLIFERVIYYANIKKIKRKYLDLLPISFYSRKNFFNDKKFTNKFLKKLFEKKQTSLDKYLKVSYIIRGNKDFQIVPVHRSRSNFVGSRIIYGKPFFLNGKENFKNLNFKNKIICIENADPGFDWIFTKNFKGLVTKFGGMNSHMYIRCAEFDLTASIGCGEGLFNKIVNSEKVSINPKTKKIFTSYN